MATTREKAEERMKLLGISPYVPAGPLEFSEAGEAELKAARKSGSLQKVIGVYVREGSAQVAASRAAAATPAAKRGRRLVDLSDDELEALELRADLTPGQYEKIAAERARRWQEEVEAERIGWEVEQEMAHENDDVQDLLEDSPVWQAEQTGEPEQAEEDEEAEPEDWGAA